MNTIVSSQQMRDIEKNIIQEIGIVNEVLMERAALAVCNVVRNHVRKPKNNRILVMCGVGNNGADGLAIARLLYEDGYQVSVCLVGDLKKRTQLNQKQFDILSNLSAESKEIDISLFSDMTDTIKEKNEYSVIIDALLGIGSNRELTGSFEKAVLWMNSLKGIKIAVDMPTGISADTGRLLGYAFMADYTVTFGYYKTGQFLGYGVLYSGDISLYSCGMQYKNRRLSEEYRMFKMNEKDMSRLLKRNPMGNKSTFGKIGIMAGSMNTPGAAILATKAAFFSGGGYIRLLSHSSLKEMILEEEPETVLSLYEDDINLAKQQIQPFIDFSDVILAGPGIGMNDMGFELLQILLQLLSISEKKITLILDADALNLIAEHEELQSLTDSLDKPVIFTPHLKEFSRLSGIGINEIKQDRIRLAIDFAKEHNIILVLKDSETVIADPDGNVCINPTGNDGMAVAGSGDVLAGIIAGLCGQKIDAYKAACTAVYLHGLSGDKAREKYGAHSMMPSDIISQMKKVFKKLGKEEK